MGCFFGCFGIKESRSNRIDSPEPVVRSRKNALSSLFVSDDETLLKGGGQNTVPRQHSIKELKDEAKFDETYGASLEIPTETHAGKGNGISAQCREGKSSELSSWFSNASTDKLKQDKLPNGSQVVVKIHKDSVSKSDSLMESPSSCMTDGNNTSLVSSSCNQRSVQNAIAPFDMQDSGARSKTSSISPLPCTPGVKAPARSIHFVSESNQSVFSSEGSSSECVSQHPKQSGLAMEKPSPYPTPLKMTHEIQTPGTEFPEYINDAYSRNHPNNGSLYPCSISKRYAISMPLERSSDHLGESLELDDEETSMATPMLELGDKHCPLGKETEDEGGLSSWFKPVSAKQDVHIKRSSSASAEKLAVRTPGDRPILGMVAAYWNEEQASPHISPKWWDGNGIPNSTNKYKEDQKVSWHATPFEERLEKALSEETTVTQRKPISSSSPVDFNSTDESDTALSHLKSSSHTNPVVSF